MSREIVRVEPDWQQSSVDYAQPPSITFYLNEVVNVEERYDTTLSIDNGLQTADEQGLGFGGSYRVALEPIPVADRFVCTFTSQRRSHLAMKSQELGMLTNILNDALQNEVPNER